MSYPPFTMSMIHHMSYPYHISLASEPSLLHALYKPFHHVSSHLPAHNNVSAPRCDVTETETSYHVDCELPSLGEQAAVHITWLENHILVIYGVFSKSDSDTDAISSAATAGSNAQREQVLQQQMKTFPRLIVHERCIGPFQRSLSFADNIDEEAMTFSLRDGLLQVNIPKAIFQDTLDRVHLQSSTG